MNDLTTVLKGNLTADPDRRTDADDRPVVAFTVAHTARRWDNEAGKFVKGNTAFVTCMAYGPQGEHIYESMRKGDRIIAEVVLTQRRYQAGEKSVPVLEGTVVEAGASLLFNEVDVDPETETGGGSHTEAKGAKERAPF